MIGHADAQPSTVAHGVAVRAAGGETRCGDHWVVEIDEHRAVLAVIDGLGHGEHAETAARAAAATISERADDAVATVMTEVHRVLRGTRGAAVSLAVIRPGRLDWLGVGNVQGVLHQASTGATTRLVTRPGIVGSRLPQLRTAETRLAHGDVLAMFTDGVDEAAAREVSARWAPDVLAPWLLERHASGTDDALVLVAGPGGGRR